MNLAVRLLFAIASLILAISFPADAQQRPSHKPTSPPVAVPLQPPSPSAAEVQQPPENEPGAAKKPGANEQRGSEDRPVIVKVLSPEKTADERAQEKRDHDDKASSDWWTVKLAGAAIGVGLLQLLAFIGQIIVFALQAQRLRDSVDEMKKATAATEKAAIAARDGASAAQDQAVALNDSLKIAADHADTSKASVDATLDMVKVMEQTAQRQLRAYVSVVLDQLIPQNRVTGYTFEVRMIVRNTGHTPAHAVNIRPHLRIFPYPLPDNIDLAIAAERLNEAGHFNPGQEGAFRARLDEQISDEEIKEIMTGDTRKLYMYGTVFYRDAFGEDHYTNFCQFGMWTRGSFFALLNAERHNDAT